MRIIAKRALREFWEKHHDAEIPLKTWHKIVEKQKWVNTYEIKKLFGNASIIGNNRVVFNIKGNDYRLVVYVAFKMQKLFIRFIGTHNQYNKIDAETI
ncbi:MAG: type II toxin-antitoxin system HigB family toxin [Bacteroidetes bacterium]|nr:type II toxin-antitoxin system HigB family toxin [Bacteroidota bacterium]